MPVAWIRHGKKKCQIFLLGHCFFKVCFGTNSWPWLEIWWSKTHENPNHATFGGSFPPTKKKVLETKNLIFLVQTLSPVTELQKGENRLRFENPLRNGSEALTSYTAKWKKWNLSPVFFEKSPLFWQNKSSTLATCTVDVLYAWIWKGVYKISDNAKWSNMHLLSPIINHSTHAE